MNLSAYIGIPYEPNAKGPHAVDCCGLIQLFYRNEFNIELPEYLYPIENDYKSIGEMARQKLAVLYPWEPVADLKLGDVLVFRIFGHPIHVGMYIGDGDFLHSCRGKSSCIERLMDWNDRLVQGLRWSP
jgi:cell wall-associated NlpC family hydrolase